ncbi:MAG: MCE family protein [Actinomycetota bacterium]|nr:MCE family protein [Actinomycetota bacterium]
MKPFRERNPIPIGAVGIVIILVLLLAAFNVAKLPFIGSGTTYKANFSEAAGLNPDDEVRVAGVKAGKVSSIKLVGQHVEVSFQIEPGIAFGRDSRAAIKIKSLLGQKYLQLEPLGPGQQSAKVAIPTTRTTAPFDVPQAFSQLSENIDAIDTDQLAQSFNVLADAFKDSPDSVRSAVTGLSRLSQTISTRDAALHDLLGHAQTVTGVLAARDKELTTLIGDGDLLLKVVQQRRQAIHDLLVNTSQLSLQLTGLVKENRAAITPALANLKGVLSILQRNQDNLDKLIGLLGPFTRDFADVLGTGRWFDTFVCNLLPTGAGVTDNPLVSAVQDGVFGKPKPNCATG